MVDPESEKLPWFYHPSLAKGTSRMFPSAPESYYDEVHQSISACTYIVTDRHIPKFTSFINASDDATHTSSFRTSELAITWACGHGINEVLSSLDDPVFGIGSGAHHEHTIKCYSQDRTAYRRGVTWLPSITRPYPPLRFGTAALTVTPRELDNEASQHDNVLDGGARPMYVGLVGCLRRTASTSVHQPLSQSGLLLIAQANTGPAKRPEVRVGSMLQIPQKRWTELEGMWKRS
ncbi:hypothetical protein EDD17DRAFT_1510170 [Pisolithus thermaeus]|nr:hypothetical protein EV401DRAFT_1888288 [Pisolithus croceorrhizus]KAI6160665.1 hypothetical protein EDD17DRAFT_1510170 [Pisolithus thermaeus]